MGKFRKILDVLLDREEKQQTDTVQDAEVIEEVNYKQASGTMVSVDANDVAVAVVDNNRQVKVARRPPVQFEQQQMGGEEIKSGTLH